MVPHVKRALYISTLILVLLGGASALGADALQQPVGQSAKHGKRRHRAHLRHHRAHRGRHRAHHPRRHRAHRGHKPGAVIHRPRFRSEANATAVLLGDTVVEWQHDLLPAGQAEAFQLTASSSGLAGAVHVYISSGSAAGTLIAGLYSASSGHPGTLLSTGSTPAPRAGTWATLSLAPASSSQAGGLARDPRRGRQAPLPGPLPRPLPERDQRRPLTRCAARGVEHRQGLLGLPRLGLRDGSAIPAPSAGLGPGLGLGLAGAPPPTSSPLEEPPAPPAPAAPLTAPLAIAPSAISGSAVQGQVLTASRGSSTGSPDSYAYQWERCSSSGEDCSEIDAANRNELQISLRRRREHPARRRHSGKLGRVDGSCLRTDRRGHLAAARSQEHRAAGHQRLGRGRPDADIDHRKLDGEPHLYTPLGRLRQFGQRLLGHHRGHGNQLPAQRGRRGAHDPRRRHGKQPRRVDDGALGADREGHGDCSHEYRAARPSAVRPWKARR